MQRETYNRISYPAIGSFKPIDFLNYLIRTVCFDVYHKLVNELRQVSLAGVVSRLLRLTVPFLWYIVSLSLDLKLTHKVVLSKLQTWNEISRPYQLFWDRALWNGKIIFNYCQSDCKGITVCRNDIRFRWRNHWDWPIRRSLIISCHIQSNLSAQILIFKMLNFDS